MTILSASTRAIAALGFAMVTSKAWACASCGSGGDDPMVLYPNEQAKVYLGLGRTSGFQGIDSRGESFSPGGPELKETLTAAAGYAFFPRCFATASVPFIRNVRNSDSRQAVGDASAAVRFTAVMLSVVDPYVPQVQLIAGYKHAGSRSIRESRDEKTLLDVFGTGFSEGKLGVDVWFGVTRLKFGLAQQYLFPERRNIDGVDYEPGIASRSTVSTTFAWTDTWKSSLGLNRESRKPLKADGVEGSSQLNHAAFLTQDWAVSQVDGVRLSMARQAAFGDNHDTARSDSVSVAYTRTL